MFRLRGICSQNPYHGLGPWIPLGDSHPPDLLQIGSTNFTTLPAPLEVCESESRLVSAHGAHFVIGCGEMFVNASVIYCIWKVNKVIFFARIRRKRQEIRIALTHVAYGR